ncbi:MotA/TolQ/ExbB proton channel family protein [Cupriavidus basilensis]|uniref:MotA/TolQ/ExbB proton channel family protein n=1 Tax=Cupriavidus basilensis TaxID=68895 RepID=A0A643FSV6_9BURK|nr:MotA/TolQ/ExbB proton channel family protein [Cupriavidus basilensis]QOT80859.1 MotA/TolQ/ExbB proton channel family protein [Cupriavidus basilensis]
MESVVTEIFFRLSTAFFWPVALALLVLFVLSLADLGGLIVQSRRRAVAPRSDLPALANALASSLQNGTRAHLDAALLSPSLARFWGMLEERLARLDSHEHLDLWLDETLQREEMRVANRLDLTRTLVRIAPMLGLAGTIIPLGPALQSLLGGDMAGMVNHLVIGFGAVVCGLVLGGIAYVLTLTRERWARSDLKEMENLCELVLRAMPEPVAPAAHARAAIHLAGTQA